MTYLMKHCHQLTSEAIQTGNGPIVTGLAD